MGRTKNATNRPRFGKIKLSQLCNLLNPDTQVPIDLKFLQALASTNSAISFEEIQESKPIKKSESSEKIEFTLIQK